AVPVRRLPPLVPVLGVPGTWRGAVRPAPDVLVLDRDVRGHELRPHLHVASPVRAADLSAGRELRAHADGADPALPAARPGVRRGRGELVGVDADPRRRLAGAVDSGGGADRVPTATHLSPAGGPVA